MTIRNAQVSTLKYLTSREREALEALVQRLKRIYGTQLLKVMLFGSKARGNYDEESDIDLLIVAQFPEKDYWHHWRRIIDEAGDVDLEYDVVISPLVRNENGYAQMQQYDVLLNRDIERDGITLWT
jgi:predicted nucleotidyltransferase